MLVLHHLFRLYWTFTKYVFAITRRPYMVTLTSRGPKRNFLPTSHAHHPVQLSRLDRVAKTGVSSRWKAKLWLSRAVVDGNAFRIKVVRKDKNVNLKSQCEAQ